MLGTQKKINSHYYYPCYSAESGIQQNQNNQTNKELEDRKVDFASRFEIPPPVYHCPSCPFQSQEFPLCSVPCMSVHAVTETHILVEVCPEKVFLRCLHLLSLAVEGALNDF